MKVNKIGITSKYDSPQALEMVETIVKRFTSQIKIFLDEGSFDMLNLPETKRLPVEKMEKAGINLIISIGGDGTVLRSISRMDDPLPLLGINMGMLGFLVDVMPDEAIPTIEKVLEGFEYTERCRIAVKLNGKELPCATNEVVLTTARPAKILTFRVTVDECMIEEFRSDGVVIATPTGSTAYAMSAGGPILDPRVNATLIVPLAPFKLSARPWVVPSDRPIKVEITIPEKEAAVVIDGQHTYTMKKEDTIHLTKAKNPARFVVTERSGFYEKVQSKLR
jgi:NAD+ kinase